jgi:hypothetical protein
MDDLNRSTNRLRRKFDPTSNYLETKVQMEQVAVAALKTGRWNKPHWDIPNLYVVNVGLGKRVEH